MSVVLFPMFHIFPSQCAHIGSTDQPWTTTQKGQPYYLDVQRAALVSIHSPVHIHICPNLPHQIHTTHFRFHLNWSDKTPSHSNSGI